MNVQLWFLLLAAVAGLGFLAWISVKNLIQASLLRSWRRMSLSGMDGRAAAVRGRVQVREVVRIAHVGDCLWFRERVQIRRGFGKSRRWVTESDTKTCAEFSILIEGDEEVRVSGEPTEVHGKKSESNTERPDLFDRFLGDSDERVTEQWLPVV